MDFVTILNPAANQSQASSLGGNAAQAQLTIGPFEVDTLVLVTACGSATYVGPTQNAGINLTVRVDDNIASEDDSFEGASSHISFRSAASYNFICEKRSSTKISASVSHMGAGGTANTDTRVSLECFALAIR